MATTEESSASVEDLQHRNMMLELENKSLLDEKALYDAQEV
jgi:hypothetical protein